MDDGFFDDVSGEFALGGKGSKRGAQVARVLFGLLLVGLAIAGAVVVAGLPAGIAFRSAGVALFAALAAFGLFNLVLHLPWRWPGRAVLAALVLLFVVRIVFGP